MAQRQFKSTDTSAWPYKYGNGSGGAVSASTATDAPIDSACTGTDGATSLTATNASFAAGQVIIIDQTRGTGANSDPSWELNMIQSYVSGTITTVLPLTHTYNSGAQVIVADQLSSFDLNGATLTAKAWDGSVGGLLVRLVNGRFFGTGTINLASKGFRGATGRAANGAGKQGEGYAGDRDNESSATNGSGAGGGTNNNGAGAGGGNSASGGTGSGGSGSTGGLSAGNASLTIFSMGGGGSSGSNQSGSGLSGDAGEGGAKLLIIAKTIDVSGMTIALTGGNGATSTGSDGSPGPGGGGAGGSALLKGQTITLGTNAVTALGGSGASGGGNTSGAGANGRIHADYSGTISGTTNPTIDSTQDFILVDSSMLALF